MLPEVAALDAALARSGQDIVLRRLGTPNVDVTARARVLSYEPQELVGGIAQTDSRVILSPTQILAASWPGDGSGLPRRNDKAVIAGRLRNIEVVDPIYMGADLVRIEMRVSG